MPECIRHRDEIRIRGDDDETVAFGVLPDLEIGSATAQTDLSDVRRARKKIPDKFHQLADSHQIGASFRLTNDGIVSQRGGPPECGEDVFFREFWIVTDDLRVGRASAEPF